MLLYNKKPLDQLPEEHPANKAYKRLVADIREEFGPSGIIILERAGYPKRDDKTGFVYETPPMDIPLQASTDVDGNGKNLWAYTATAPEVLPNGLYEIKIKKMQINGTKSIEVARDIDLAVFLVKLSPFVRTGELKIKDDGREAREREKVQRARLELMNVVYNELKDDKEIRLVASAWGIPNVDSQDPAILRESLVALLQERDKQKKQNPGIRGTREFVDSFKDRDGIIAGSIIQKLIDSRQVTYQRETRRYLIGNREVCTVPIKDEAQHSAYLSRYLQKNKSEMILLLKDTITPEFIDAIDDWATYVWMAKLEDMPHYKMKKEDVIKALKDAFCA